MSDRLILARHGESEFSVRQIVNGDPGRACPLTRQGIDESLDLALALREVSVDVCVTSEFSRVQQTADIALAGRPVPRHVEPRLNDPRVGQFESRPLGEYLDWFGRAAIDERPPGAGESQLDALRRYLEAYEDLVRRPERTILVIGHAFPIALALSIMDDTQPALRPRYDTSIPYASMFEVENSLLGPALERLRDEMEAGVR